jgi:hypothetical protein
MDTHDYLSVRSSAEINRARKSRGYTRLSVLFTRPIHYLCAQELFSAHSARAAWRCPYLARPWILREVL